MRSGFFLNCFHLWLPYGWVHGEFVVVPIIGKHLGWASQKIQRQQDSVMNPNDLEFKSSRSQAPQICIVVSLSEEPYSQLYDKFLQVYFPGGALNVHCAHWMYAVVSTNLRTIHPLFEKPILTSQGSGVYPIDREVKIGAHSHVVMHGGHGGFWPVTEKPDSDTDNESQQLPSFLGWVAYHEPYWFGWVWMLND